MMKPEEYQRREEFVESLTPEERGLYAEMIMQSLRGSWTSPRERTQILEIIVHGGKLIPYDRTKLSSKIQNYFANIGRGSPDGRYWRGYYGEVDVSEFEESTVRKLSSRIPNDMTWDDSRIRKELFEE